MDCPAGLTFDIEENICNYKEKVKKPLRGMLNLFHVEMRKSLVLN